MNIVSSNQSINNINNMNNMNKLRSKSLDMQNNDPRIKYKIKKKPLGKGSFSTVYYATNLDGEEFAIKSIPFVKLDEKLAKKFLMELEIVQNLDHDNVVTCFEVFKTDIHWYIVSEYCNFGTFDKMVDVFKKIDFKQKEEVGIYYLSQLKDALQYLYSHEIIHRDLKPMNILLHKNKNGEIILKLADFGFSRHFDIERQNLTGFDDMVGTLCGTPIYMAPELLISMKYNTKADLWSFGVIMYELLYGNNPYNYPKSISQLRNLIETQKITFTRYFSNECINLLTELLQVDPIKRISWNNFFNHIWFSLDIEEVTTTIKPNRESQENVFHMDESIMELHKSDVFKNKITCMEKSTNINNSNMAPTPSSLHDFAERLVDDYFSPKFNDTNDDYILVNKKNEINKKVKTYNETISGSVINILSQSISYFFNQAKSY